MNEGAPNSVIEFDQPDLDPSGSTVFDLPRTEPPQLEPLQNQTTPEQNFGSLEPGCSPAELAARDEQIQREAQQLFEQQLQEMLKAAAAAQVAREIEEIKKLNAAANDKRNPDLYARPGDFPPGKTQENFEYVKDAVQGHYAGLRVTNAQGKPDVRFEDGSLLSEKFLNDSQREMFFEVLKSAEKTENGQRAHWTGKFQDKDFIGLIAIDANGRVIQKFLNEKDPVEQQPQQKQPELDDTEPQNQIPDQNLGSTSGQQSGGFNPVKIFAPSAQDLAAASNREHHDQVPAAADLPAQTRQNTELNAQAITAVSSIEHDAARSTDNSVPENQPAAVVETDLVQPGATVQLKSNEAQSPDMAELDLDENTGQDSKLAATVEASIAGAANSTGATKVEATPAQNPAMIEASQAKAAEQHLQPAEQLTLSKDQREFSATAAEIIAKQFRSIEAATGIAIEQSQGAQTENSAAANQPAQREQKALENTEQPAKATVADPAKTFESTGISLIVGSEAQSADRISSDTPFDSVIQRATNFEQLGSSTFVAAALEMQRPETVETVQAADVAETSASVPNSAAQIRRSDAKTEGKNISAAETADTEMEVQAEPESNIPSAEIKTARPQIVKKQIQTPQARRIELFKINTAKSPTPIPQTPGTSVNSRLKPNANARINREIPDFTAVIDPQFVFAPNPKPTPRQPDIRSEIQSARPEQLEQQFERSAKQPAKVAFINQLPRSKPAANLIDKDFVAIAAEQIRTTRQEHRAVKNLLENRRSAEIQKRFGAAGRAQDQDQTTKHNQPSSRRPTAVRQLSLAA